ncbi:hypothetical protein Acsp02_53040 [Actinoplanes sp. NBRC 103695]|nr:hypothetical protein Acsp02_53040 [Actinoplanes sp. NBRC 103695]
MFAVALAAGLFTGALPAAAAPSAQPAVPSAQPRVVARYDFDGHAVADDSGNGHTMRVISRRGGRLGVVAHGNGRAVQFPSKCSGAKCPHVVLQTPHAADLNPGRRPIQFGATVRLTATETSKGQNVLQKGYSRKGSQYKLQVDGRMGRPSCVLVDVAASRIRLARSSVSVSDGRWHAVQCRRSGTQLSVLVDGQVRGQVTVPEKLSVINRFPLSIGGKGAYNDNDQFRGAVDDVWVRIG